jgi:parvulin-like peptidyl-prolyl isomerase
MRPSLVPFVVALLLGPAGCEDKDPVVLRLDGEAVHRSDFDHHLASLALRGFGPLAPEARRGVLESYLEQRALVIEARHRGLLAKDDPPDQEGTAVARLLASAAESVQVSPAEVTAWYADHHTELSTPERVTVRQILVGSLNEARDVKRRLARNPRSFDTLARTLSKGPEAELGGYMGVFERGQLPPELEAAAFALPEGATSDPVASPLGYHVLKVESRQAAREIPLEEARERIRDRLARAKREQAERTFLAQVMARAKVNYEAALAPTPSQ